LIQRRHRGAHVVGDGSIDWFATLLQALELEALASPPAPGAPPATSDRAPSRLAASRPTLKRRPRRLAREGRWVLALDCSASMLVSGALSAAKGVARALASRAASRSIEIALVSFGGDAVSAVSGSRRQGANIERAILSLGASGGTPLRRAVEIALETLARPGPLLMERRLFLLTDGRTREKVDDLAAHSSAVRATVIDCERGPLRLGRARRIAATLKADYVHIAGIDAGPRELEAAVRAAPNSQRT
jgi:Mg-chelatase subunit ChlD